MKIATPSANAFASAVAGTVLLAWGLFTAQALPAAAFQASHERGAVTLVAERCGAGWHRDLDGRCRRDGEIVINPLLPLVVEPGRVCPFGTHFAPRRRECIRD
jgi:hypothetical protein